MQVRLQEMRSTEDFQRLYDQTIKLANLRDENEAQKSKRHKSAPRHLSDYFAHSSSPSSVIKLVSAKELLRIYYEAVAWFPGGSAETFSSRRFRDTSGNRDMFT